MPSPLAGHTFRISDPFWSWWQDLVIDQSLPHQWQMCEETGRIENFRKTAAGDSDGHQGRYYNDSDVYKWLEAACYALALKPDASVRGQVGEIISLIDRSQAADGYIYTPNQLGHMDWKYHSLVCRHELYCMGHLIEAGVASSTADIGDSLLNVVRKVADHVCSTFGEVKMEGYPGHQEVELALCALADVDGRPEYREMSRYFIDRRGRKPSVFERELLDDEWKHLSPGYYNHLFNDDGSYNGEYSQDDLPLEEQTRPVGHAVRAVYNFCGAIDSYPQGMPEGMSRALQTIWRTLIDRRIYVTGGIGSSPHNEGFTVDFDLPNRRAYAETCAAIGLIFWASRMSQVFDSGEYADILETALYNSALSGLSLDGKRFFYDNPLESTGWHHRKPWFECACCPPNIARLLLSLDRYAVWRRGDTLAFDLYIGGRISGPNYELEVESGMPENGQVKITWKSDSPSGLKLRLRVPGWARSAEARINGKTVSIDNKNGLWTLEQGFSAGDEIELDFGVKAEALFARPEVSDAQGRAAIQRGPLIYCVEQTDLGAPVEALEISSRISDSKLSGLGPASAGLTVEGAVATNEAGDPLYKRQGFSRKPVQAPFVPYYAWDNREAGTMQVWVRHRSDD